MNNQDMQQKSMEARFLQLPRTELEALQQCEACGETIFPKRFTLHGEMRYIPGRCKCQEDIVKRTLIEEQRKSQVLRLKVSIHIHG